MSSHDGNWRVFTSAFLNGERVGVTENLDAQHAAPRDYRSALDLQHSFLAHVIQRYGTAEVSTLVVHGRSVEYAVRRPNGYVRYINLVPEPLV